MTAKQAAQAKDPKPEPEPVEPDDQDDEDDDQDDEDDDQDDGDVATPPPRKQPKRFQDDHPPATRRTQGKREEATYDDVRPALRLW